MLFLILLLISSHIIAQPIGQMYASNQQPAHNYIPSTQDGNNLLAPPTYRGGSGSDFSSMSQNEDMPSDMSRGSQDNQNTRRNRKSKTPQNKPSEGFLTAHRESLSPQELGVKDQSKPGKKRNSNPKDMILCQICEKSQRTTILRCNAHRHLKSHKKEYLGKMSSS